MGTYLGIVIEQRPAFGRQVILLTPKAREMAEVLRAADYLLTEVKGHIHNVFGVHVRQVS
jgi:hypothetical protein